MKKYIYITADTNDGDYVSNLSEISDGDVKLLEPVFAALQKRADKLNEDLHANWNEWRHNWFRSEYGRGVPPEMMYEDVLTKEQIEIFDEYAPYFESGIHTIESIEIFEVSNERPIFNIRKK